MVVCTSYSCCRLELVDKGGIDEWIFDSYREEVGDSKRKEDWVSKRRGEESERWVGEGGIEGSNFSPTEKLEGVGIEGFYNFFFISSCSH